MINSTDIIIHEEFNLTTISNDIALIRLTEPVDPNEYIQIVPLPQNNEDQYAGATVRISGWGLTDGSANELSDVLRYVDVIVMTNEICKLFFNYITAGKLCTSGQQSTGSCNGDSGGPLTLDGVQVGIVSFGVLHCSIGYPSAFTRIPFYLNWINENSNSLKEERNVERVL